ncbi:hypothetical protein [Ruegeria arenilitoris]|uniref:hypothetical protein n=1 Tax=Ruegeria arenilitoris TaxID=1173585 RepID=UPI00147E010C|nr:hypothetical protein [Ruegeria arenilitoris]
MAQIRNKNTLSHNKEYQRRKKIAEEFNQLLRDEGFGSLFPNETTQSEKTAKRRLTLISEAIAIGMDVPQQLRDEVDPPFEPNPPTNYVDDGKPLFGSDDEEYTDEIPY